MTKFVKKKEAKPLGSVSFLNRCLLMYLVLIFKIELRRISLAYFSVILTRLVCIVVTHMDISFAYERCLSTCLKNA